MANGYHLMSSLTGESKFFFTLLSHLCAFVKLFLYDMFVFFYRQSVLIYEHQLPQLSSILRAVSPNRRRVLKTQVEFVFNNHFKNMPNITMTILDTVKERVFSHFSRSLEVWNHIPSFELVSKCLNYSLLVILVTVNCIVLTVNLKKIKIGFCFCV